AHIEIAFDHTGHIVPEGIVAFSGTHTAFDVSAVVNHVRAFSGSDILKYVAAEQDGDRVVAIAGYNAAFHRTAIGDRVVAIAAVDIESHIVAIDQRIVSATAAQVLRIPPVLQRVVAVAAIQIAIEVFGQVQQRVISAVAAYAAMNDAVIVDFNAVVAGLPIDIPFDMAVVDLDRVISGLPEDIGDHDRIEEHGILSRSGLKISANRAVAGVDQVITVVAVDLVADHRIP